MGMKTSDHIQMLKYMTRESSPSLSGAISERKMFAKGTTIKSQLPLDEYITIVKEMVADPNYRPPVNLNAKEVGRIPNFEKAKEIVKQEMGEGFTQAYERNLNRGRKVRAKEKRKVDPELKARYLASKAERRRAGRIEKLGGDIKMTPQEKFLNFQQSLVTKQLNEKIRENPDLILRNESLMDQLSTTVDKNGNIIKVKPTLEDIKNRGIFEIEHQRDIYKTGKMKDFPYNRNLILGPYNRTGGFKATAEKFIEKFPDPNNPKVKAILEKADELGITIRPDVPEGTFPTKALGYKQAADPVKKFIDVATKVTPALTSNDLGIPSYKGNIDMAKKALGVKELAAEAVPGSRATAEFLQSIADNVAAKQFGKAGLKLLGGAGALYGVYDTAVGFKEGKSAPELAARFVGLDPVYQEIKQYSRMSPEGQELQKKKNAYKSFEASQYDAMDEGLMGLRAPQPMTEEETKKLELEQALAKEQIANEEAETASQRMGLVERAKKAIMDMTGQPYELALAGGGRVYLSEGGKPKNLGRRKFIQGALSLAAALPFLGPKIFKPASKAAPEVIEAVTRTAEAMPTYLTKLIEKVKMMGTSKIIGKMDSPDEFMRYDLGDYELFEGAGGARLKRVRDRGDYGYEEFEMQIKQDPETGFVEYEEVSVRPDYDGKLKDIDFGIEDDVHKEMEKFAYDD